MAEYITVMFMIIVKYHQQRFQHVFFYRMDGNFYLLEKGLLCPLLWTKCNPIVKLSPECKTRG